MQVKECAISGLTLSIQLSDSEVKDVSCIYDEILTKNVPDYDKLLITEVKNAHKIMRNYYYDKIYLFSLAHVKKNQYWKMNTKNLIHLSAIIQQCINYSYNTQLSDNELIWLYFYRNIFTVNNHKIPLDLVSKGCLLNIGGYGHAS